tara:strand:+ start:672 stop:851 length:180 start_codon:yes stop_codon:yes gene_type:complete
MNTYGERTHNTESETVMSYWLRDAIKSLESRDIVDAINDVEILLGSLNVRLIQVETENS